MATNFVDLNVLLNILTILLVVSAAFPIVWSRRKDAVIAEQGLVIDSHTKRIDALESDLIGAQARANEATESAKRCELRAAEWEAKYAEQSKYTASAAVVEFQSQLREHNDLVTQRHMAMMQDLKLISKGLTLLIERTQGESAPTED